MKSNKPNSNINPKLIEDTHGAVRHTVNNAMYKRGGSEEGGKKTKRGTETGNTKWGYEMRAKGLSSRRVARWRERRDLEMGIVALQRSG
ncbi:hypothetical protein QE152_g27117 [Popillia japonica]|uniref:Uncharacterized protein n=1 Tax=Popillia japonica TaxID=7064 RepID=A0AAW1JVQ8_POPJA